jgi:ParB/RepB/Spo0J family partition protein
MARRKVVEEVTQGEDLERMQDEVAPGRAQTPQQVILLDPCDIQAPVEMNTRRFQTSRESITSLAMSMLEDGQQVPVKVAEAPDGSYRLVFGWRRWQAAMLINEGYWSPELYRIQAIVVPLGDESPASGAGLIAGVVENAQRVGLGPVDEAYAIRLMKDAGMTQTAIARKMGVSSATITQRLKLLELPAVTQKRVNRGEVAVEQALLALGVADDTERAAAVKDLAVRPVSKWARAEVREEAEAAQAVVEGDVVEGDSGEVVKPIRPKTAKKMLAELEEYATPADDTERTKAQVWLLTKLIPWVKNPKRKFQRVMDALEELGLR